MIPRVALLVLFLLALGCGPAPSEPCAPSPATHRMICAGIGEFKVYVDGGRICDPRGGEIRTGNAQCIRLPMIYPAGGTDGPENTKP